MKTFTYDSNKIWFFNVEGVSAFISYEVKNLAFRAFM
jgi:hypothetical protein